MLRIFHGEDRAQDLWQDRDREYDKKFQDCFHGLINRSRVWSSRAPDPRSANNPVRVDGERGRQRVDLIKLEDRRPVIFRVDKTLHTTWYRPPRNITVVYPRVQLAKDQGQAAGSATSMREIAPMLW